MDTHDIDAFLLYVSITRVCAMERNYSALVFGLCLRDGLFKKIEDLFYFIFNRF